MENQPSNTILPFFQLLKQTFLVWRQHVRVFAALLGINIIAWVLMVAVWAGFFATARHNHVIGAFTFFLLFCALAIGACWITFLVRIAMIYMIANPADGKSIMVRLSDAHQVAGSYVWLSVLVGLVIMIGLILFIIPGIIAMVWFSFAGYALLLDGKKGTEAMSASRQLVRGHWWGIFGRFLVLMVASSIISSIPLIGPLVNLFFMLPFFIIFTYLMYRDLQRLKA